MKPRIDMIGIITSQFELMRDFYRDVMRFPVQLEMEQYVEFENDGVRFAISTSDVMAKATGDDAYTKTTQGHSFELAFRADSPLEVDSEYQRITSNGAKSVKDPADMPWGQRAAFFADPDGNVHEIFADVN